MSARQRQQRPNDALQQSTSPSYASHRIYANVRLNGSTQIRFMVDTGADVSIISTASANSIKLNTRNSTGSLNLIGVTGGSGAPLVNVRMQIENQPAFNTRIAVANSNFNLLCLRDLSVSHDVRITNGRTVLIPRSRAAVNAINTIRTDPVPTSTLNLTEDQMRIAVMIITALLVLSVIN